MRDGARIMGFKSWQEFIPHSLRGYFVTQMANSKDVSDVERMRSTRHMNPATSATYQSRSSVTETAKFIALGIRPPTTTTTTTTTKTIPFKDENQKVSSSTARTTTVSEIFPIPKVTTTTKSEGQGSFSTARTTTISETFPVTSTVSTPSEAIPSRTKSEKIPSTTTTTTTSDTANIVSGFRVRGGGRDDSKCSKVSVVTDQYEDKDFDDETFPHTQLAMEECDHDIKQLESTLDSGSKSSTGISATAIRVQKMAGKVRELTKLVKSLNEKVAVYEDILYNAGLKECEDLITTATTTGRKRNCSPPKQLFSPVNTPNHQQTTTPTVTNPYQRTTPYQRISTSNQQTNPINPYQRRRVTPPHHMNTGTAFNRGSSTQPRTVYRPFIPNKPQYHPNFNPPCAFTKNRR